VFYGSENVEVLHRHAVNELAAQVGIAATEVDLAEGSAARAIIDTAAYRRADLTLVGAAQRRGVAAAVLGNTAELVAGEVPCDVLIVPATDTAQAAPAAQSKVG
jgi:universal stress protein E